MNVAFRDTEQPQDWLDGTGWVGLTGIRPSGVRTRWLFDSLSGEVASDQAIRISAGVIEDVHQWAGGEPSHNHLDLSHYCVVPGLIDAHAHLSSIYDPFEPNAYLTIAAANSAVLTTHVIRNGQRCLRMGITCVRDMPGFTNFMNQEAVAIREAGIRRLIAVPRIVAYGWVEPNAGHMDLALPARFRSDPTVYADGPYEVRKMARRMIREGVDGFKTATSGGLGGRMEEVWWTKYTDEELLALTEEAHGVGKLVAAHAHTDEAVQQALRCGVDTIEHGVFMKPETADLMAKRQIPFVPTLAVTSGRAVERAKAAGAVTPHQIRKRQALVAAQGEVMKLAYERGLLIATGTDAYFTLRGDYWGLNGEEIQLFIEAGVPPHRALKAGTIGAAAAVGLADKVGAVAKGRFADLVAYTRSPLEDPSCLTDPSSVAIVIKDGEVVAGSFAGLRDILAQLGSTATFQHVSTNAR